MCCYLCAAFGISLKLLVVPEEVSLSDCMKIIIHYAQAIDSLLSSEFIRASQFLQQPSLIAGIASEFSRDPDANPRLPTVAAQDEEDALLSLEDEMTPLVLGLKRTGHLSSAIRLLRSAAAEEVKVGIRQGL